MYLLVRLKELRNQIAILAKKLASEIVDANSFEDMELAE